MSSAFLPRQVPVWCRGRFVPIMLAALWLPAAALAATLKLGQEGLEVEAGSLGRLTLEHPKLLDAGQQPNHKVVETTVNGNTARLRYEGGAVAEVTLGQGGKVSMKFSNLPGDVKNIGTALQLPIAFNQGGSWKMGGKTAAFPKTKPEKPHLYQGHAADLVLTAYDGRSLTVQVPGNTFLQLADNREWNWSIFHWHSFTPVESGQPELVFTLTDSGAASGKVKPLVDALGQSTRETWPDKVASVDQLKADVEAEKAYYASLNPPLLDEYGGLPGSRERLGLKATGYFHVTRKNDRWLLVNPAGNAFFHLGLCVVNPNDDYTVVQGREAAYEWLPRAEGEYASAFRPGSNGSILSFHLVNQIRKYGQPYDPESYTARMISRMKKWGFNSIGAFSSGGDQARQDAKFPTVAHLPINVWEGVPRVPGIHETFDPFDEQTRAVIEANMARELPARARDPLIIGYFIVNEPIYEQIPHVVPSLPGSKHACKRRLVAWLKEKYGTVAAWNQAWGAQASGFEELLETGLAMTTPAAKADAEAFASHFLDEYLKLVKTSFRKHDPHHLLLGSRLQPGTIRHEWICRAMAPHVDVMSYNYYTYEVDTAHLRQVHEWTGGLPLMLSEFFWSSPTDSGLDGGREVASQRARGLMYRKYVEQSAALGFVVGTEWFTLVDQSVTGRWFSGFDGERSNSGVLSVTDRPWKPLLEEMMKTNYDIYRVWLGERKPWPINR